MSRERVEVDDHVVHAFESSYWDGGERCGLGDHRNHRGHLTTDHGIVLVQMWWLQRRGKRPRQVLYMSLIREGVDYSRWEERTESRALTTLGATRVVKRWVRDLDRNGWRSP